MENEDGKEVDHRRAVATENAGIGRRRALQDRQ